MGCGSSCWASEGKLFKLRRLSDNVVGVQIRAEPDNDNDGEQNKPRTVSHCRKKGQQKNPEGDVIGDPDQGQRMGVSLFD